MGRPITATGLTLFVNANIGGREYSGTVTDGFFGDVCRCIAHGELVNLTQANYLPQDQRGWYRICADKYNINGKDHSGISYTYSGTYDLSNRESVQYAQINIDNTSDPAYSGGGRVDFTIYWAAIGPLDPSCVPPDPYHPGTDYPWFDSDEWYRVNVAASPADGGTVYGDGVFTKNASCNIVAVPKPGWAFTGWTSSRGETGSNASHTFTVSGDVTWTAHFYQIPYTVTVAASPADGGTVSGGGTFYYDIPCTITATPNSGKSFIRWEASDGSTADTATHTFRVKKNITWTAIFQDGWRVRVRIMRGTQLGYFAAPTWWNTTAREIENTPTSYIAVIDPRAFQIGPDSFHIILNDASKSEIALVRVKKGYDPGDYTEQNNLDRVVVNRGVRYSLDFEGADVEIYLRYKSTGALLYGTSGALLHGKGGNPLYL